MAKIYDELNATGCCKCPASSARPGHAASAAAIPATNNPNRPPLSISLPEVKKHHASLLIQLLYTGRVNLEDGEDDRQGVLDLLERLDIKINPAALSREEIRGRKGRKSLSITPPETASETPPAFEETPTTSTGV